MKLPKREFDKPIDLKAGEYRTLRESTSRPGELRTLSFAVLGEPDQKTLVLKRYESEPRDKVVNLEGPSDKDFDLYLRYGLRPEWTKWDDKGYTSTSEETVRAYPTKTGNYYIMVHAFRRSGDYTLKASH